MSVKYHTHTVADVRAWLYEGAKNGLSEHVISKVRANAIIHNPFVEDDMVVVISATDGDRVVGYTAMFPDYLVRPDVKLTCPTTLYADPDYADEFIGYNVTKLLHDTAHGRLVIGSDIAKEAAVIDKLLGLKVEKINRRRYVLNRSIKIRTIRQLGSKIIEPYRRYVQKKQIKRMICDISDYVQVEYTNFIDADAYRFIVDHSKNDLFLRTQEMLNWILRYPFCVKCASNVNLTNQNYFASQLIGYETQIVKVYENKELIGLYMLLYQGNAVSVKMIYTSDKYANEVYNVLLRDAMHTQPDFLYSQYVSLNKYIDSCSIYLKYYNESFIFTHPKELNYQSDLQLQGIDGDMFV